jgi:RimJ/RimL family protein N-acetyltransferase
MASGSIPALHRRGLMTEAAGRVTDYAFRKLGWPYLWLSNALDNHGSRRIKGKKGAQLVDLLIGRYVGGESSRMVWLLMRQIWMSRRTGG